MILEFEDYRVEEFRLLVQVQRVYRPPMILRKLKKSRVQVSGFSVAYWG